MEQFLCGHRPHSDEFSHRVLAKVRDVVHSRAHASMLRHWEREDLIQEAAAEVLSAIDGFNYRGKGSLEAFVCTVTVRVLASLKRLAGAYKRGQKLQVNASHDQIEAGTIVRKATRLTPSRILIREEVLRRYREGLEKLSLEERYVLCSLPLKDETAASVGRRLGLSERSVYRLKARACNFLEHHLRGF